MVVKRFVTVMLVLFALQAAAFSSCYRDLLALRSPASVLAASPDEFRRIAESSLRRPRLTRPQLERIAEAATLCGAHDIEVAARERLWARWPADAHLGTQLGDALRRARRFDEAEQVFRQVITQPLLAGQTP